VYRLNFLEMFSPVLSLNNEMPDALVSNTPPTGFMELGK